MRKNAGLEASLKNKEKERRVDKVASTDRASV